MHKPKELHKGINNNNVYKGLNPILGDDNVDTTFACMK
jgi:hypothetical protein